MLTLPAEYITILASFAPVFSKRIWLHVEVLLLGAILAPSQRTVTAALRIMGLSLEKHFENYHRVLSRAVWSSRELSRRLLGLLIEVFAARGPVVLGMDDTIGRCRGAKIKGQGHLSGSGAFESQPLRESQWLALVERDVAGADPVGAAGLGAALPDRAGAFGALLSGEHTGPQEAHRLGPAGTFAGETLVAGAKTGCGDGC